MPIGYGSDTPSLAHLFMRPAQRTTRANNWHLDDCWSRMPCRLLFWASSRRRQCRPGAMILSQRRLPAAVVVLREQAVRGRVAGVDAQHRLEPAHALFDLARAQEDLG